MALLDMLRKQTGLRLVVAHYDHGIRSDSIQDRQLVQSFADKYDIQFVYDNGELGSDASEDEARQARYGFLHRVREVTGAKGIITAHHQDDLLETATHNMLRGTGWRGLVSLRSREYIRRPLLHIPKSDLIAYAQNQGLQWREDSTNNDLRYRRNYIRHNILPKLSADQKDRLLHHIRNIRNNQSEIDTQLVNYLHMQPNRWELDRQQFILLPHAVAREVIAHWLRGHQIRDFTNNTLERVVMASKTFRIGKRVDITNNHYLVIKKDVLAIRSRDR